MSLARAITVVSVVLTTTVSALDAQGSGLSPADTKEIASYTLTMDAMRKYEATLRAYTNEMKKDPKVQKLMKLQAEVAALKKKDEPTDADQERITALETQVETLEEQLDDADIGALFNSNSISEMADMAAKAPRFSVALRSAGFKPREYAVFAMALFQASMYAGMKKSGVLKDKDIPKHISRAQLKFVEDHEAEFKAMQERFKEMSKP